MTFSICKTTGCSSAVQPGKGAEKYEMGLKRQAEGKSIFLTHVFSAGMPGAGISPRDASYIVKKYRRGISCLKDYIEERAMEVASYIINTNATVRQAAKQFGISKSTVHTVVTKWNVFRDR